MHSTDRRVSTDSGSTSISLWWALMLGTCGASLIALTVSAQIYLSMLHHGHSFIRLAVWQLCSWSIWAAATPAVLRLGGRLTDRSARVPHATLRVIAMGLVILTAHSLFASAATVWSQPYAPVETFRFGTALIFQAISIPVDLLVYGLLLVIGTSVSVYHRA